MTCDEEAASWTKCFDGREDGDGGRGVGCRGRAVAAVLRGAGGPAVLRGVKALRVMGARRTELVCGR